MLYVSSILIYAYTSNKIPYKNTTEYKYIPREEQQLVFNDKADCRKQISALFGNPLYFYTTSDNPKFYGRTYITFRVICMNETINDYMYCFYLAHELVHLTQVTQCERYVSFQAFKILYNSPYKDIALWYANFDIGGSVNEEYSCRGYIEDYLKEIEQWPI